MSVEDRVRSVVLGVLNVKADEVVPSARFRDLGASSIDMVEILAGLENEFNVDVPDEAAAQLTTVQSAVDYFALKV